MLYKRGAGTQAEPYSVCYRWNAVPALSARAGDNLVVLSFPDEVVNNGKWPEAKAWTLTDSRGTRYSVTGASAANRLVTLTVFPALAENAELTVEYTQEFDDISQGLNDAKGAILRAADPQNPFLRFGLPGITLKTLIGAGGDEDECGCGKNAGACPCGAMNVGCGCVHGKSNALRIVSDALHYLVRGQPSVLHLEAEGGTAPYVWEIGGALPEGLDFSEDGTVKGSPAASGSFPVTVRVSDSAGAKVSKRFSLIVVEDEKLAVATDTLPDAQVGMFYAARVRGSGGTKPYAWEIETLPAWLRLDSSSGILSGTPDKTEIHGLIVRARDGEGNTESKFLRLSVYPHDGLTVTTRVLPAAVRGRKYAARLEASGGIPPYFFAPRRGSSLPPGLTLDSAGEISGTPVEKGAYGFTMDVMDGNGLQGSAVYTMAILGEEDSFEFLVRECESEKRFQLSFYLPPSFDDADILGVEPLINPDAHVAGFSFAITRERDKYRVRLTLQMTVNGGGSWRSLLDSLTLDGVTVRFQDASGEEIRFEKVLPVKEMEREEPEGRSGGGGGCDVVWGMPLFSLALIAVLTAIKRKR
jgi:hypothetical protein